MTLRFGTDGVRGPAADLTPDLLRALGAAAAEVLAGPDGFLIGRDTRVSGPTIEADLAEGLATGGVRVISMGVAPTPAVAFASARRGVPAAVISASHNPWTDNGVKFFAAGGRKLGDEVEAALEAALDRHLADPRPASSAPPAARGEEDLASWVDAVVAATEGRRLEGLRLVVDCANGAASAVAATVLGRLGAEVDVLHATPDGRNINDQCGSTRPEDLQRRVVEVGASLGLALDGDADRLLAVDETGRVVDGDQLLALFAVDLRARGRLVDDHVVVTVMTNLGFHQAMADAGIDVVTTPVGDRHVLEALARGGWSLGGEQSGHLVFADLATTGDGVLSGALLADLVHRAGRPLSQLADSVMVRLPQVLRNVVVDLRRPEVAELVAAEIDAEERVLGGQGRVLVRPSGTEPLVRVMVEAATVADAAAVADRLAVAVRAACAGSPS